MQQDRATHIAIATTAIGKCALRYAYVCLKPIVQNMSLRLWMLTTYSLVLFQETTSISLSDPNLSLASNPFIPHQFVILPPHADLLGQQ